MDSNVFISALKEEDPYHPEAKLLERRLRSGKVSGVTSTLTLVETSATAARLYRERFGAHDEKAMKVFVVRTLLRLAALRLEFVNVGGDVPMAIRGIRVDLPGLFNEAILLSLRTNLLKTLDLQHLAAASYARTMCDGLSTIVTGDSDFLRNKEEILRLVGMDVLSPREFVGQAAERRRVSMTRAS